MQLSTEQKIAELNKLNDVFIRQIDQYEAKCIQSCSSNSQIRDQFVAMLNEVNEFYFEKTNYLKGHTINDTHNTHKHTPRKHTLQTHTSTTLARNVN